jgi:hypothetical protein
MLSNDYCEAEHEHGWKGKKQSNSIIANKSEESIKIKRRRLIFKYFTLGPPVFLVFSKQF